MVTSEYFDGVLAAEIIDHGDGTGIHEFYDSEGNITGQELLSGLEPWADEPEIPTVAEAMSKATRYRAGAYRPVANARMTDDWAALGLPEIYNESCLFVILICSTTSTGTVRATGKIIHG